MKVDGKHTRTIWVEADANASARSTRRCCRTVMRRSVSTRVEDAAHAIKTDAGARRAADRRGRGLRHGARARGRMPPTRRWSAPMRCCIATRPTAINLKWALDEMMAAVRNRPRDERVAAAYRRAQEIADEDVAINAAIGRHGLEADRGHRGEEEAGEPVNVLTHCNAGWLATVDWGTATSPIYQAHDKGIPIHVWVDETRPRNQGASLTAWELGQHGVPHTVIPDNTGGHLMQHGAGRYRDRRHRPRHRAGRRLRTRSAPTSRRSPRRTTACRSMWRCPRRRSTSRCRRRDGNPDRAARRRRGHDHDRPHRRRPHRDRAHRAGRLAVANYGFDVTPARLVTGLITERGVIAATREALAGAFPERAEAARATRSEAAEVMSYVDLFVGTWHRRAMPATALASLLPARRPPVGRPRSRSRAAPRGCCISSASRR